MATSIASLVEIPILTGTPSANRSSSENMTLLGSATATSTLPSSSKRTGIAQ